MYNRVAFLVERAQDDVVPSEERPGHALPLLLLDAFRNIIDSLHQELAQHGHPDVRPVHGFALQAIGRGSGTATGLARALGVSRQAAAKTVRGLEQLDYIERETDPKDRRSQRLVLTRRGREVLELSAAFLTTVRTSWVERLGASTVNDLEDALRTVGARPEVADTIDLPGWLTG
jgi:DNA-binding MarR family transcriptional regulator